MLAAFAAALALASCLFKPLTVPPGATANTDATDAGAGTFNGPDATRNCTTGDDGGVPPEAGCAPCQDGGCPPAVPADGSPEPDADGR